MFFLFVNSYTKPLNQSANSPPQYVESSSVSMTNTMSMAVCHCTQDLTYNVHGIFLRVASPFRTVKNVCVAQFSGQMCQIFCRVFAKNFEFSKSWRVSLWCAWDYLLYLLATAGSFDGFGMVEIHFATANQSEFLGYHETARYGCFRK